MVIGSLIADNYGGSGKGVGASNLEPGIILAGGGKNGCLTHFITTFVSVCLKKLIVRVYVQDVSRKFVTLVTSEPGGNIYGICGNHDQVDHGHHAHELSSERLVKASEVLFFLDGGCQYLFR